MEQQLKNGNKAIQEKIEDKLFEATRYRNIDYKVFIMKTIGYTG